VSDKLKVSQQRSRDLEEQVQSLQQHQEAHQQSDTSSLNVVQAVAAALGLTLESDKDSEEIQGLLVQKANELRQQEVERASRDQEGEKSQEEETQSLLTRIGSLEQENVTVRKKIGELIAEKVASQADLQQQLVPLPFFFSFFI